MIKDDKIGMSWNTNLRRCLGFIDIEPIFRILVLSLHQVHQQIRADHTPAKDIKSAIDELKKEIQ
jgi:hypothetical protein